jgi:RNA polymerase sigma-70 factor (ECF subfamily)
MNGGSATNPESWVERYGDVLYSYAMLRLRNAERAEEVVQETFLAALRARERFADQSSEQTWLIGILKHKLADHFRAASRAREREGEPGDEEGPEPFFTRRGLWKNAPGRWARGADFHLEQREFWETFKRCLSGLPGRLAQVFVLREMDGHSTEEVCELLDISATNLWTLLHRARLRLRACLESRWFGPMAWKHSKC